MIFNTLKYILNHPYNKHNKIAALSRFIKWQLVSRLVTYPMLYPLTENSLLVISKGQNAATANIYCGLMEFNDMGFLLHFLRSSDTFLDVGANVGVFSILASAEVGASAVSIEPIPKTYKILNKNISVNNLQNKVVTLNIGLGSEKGSLNFTESLDALNHVVFDSGKDTVNVQVDRLDDLPLKATPVLIKIDVEGYESDVLNGGEDLLNRNALKAIIIELNGSGKKYGYDDLQIHNSLLKKNFAPYAYDPYSRALIKLKTFGAHNTIYVRDLDFVIDRLKNGRLVTVGNQSF